MRKYLVTIETFSEEIEAQNSNEAKVLCYKALQSLGSKYGVPLSSTQLLKICRAKLISPRKNSNNKRKGTRYLTSSKIYTINFDFLDKSSIEWLTGFWEGDGSLSGNGSVSFYQKGPEILYQIAELLRIPKKPRFYKGGCGLVIGLKEGSHSLASLISSRVVSEFRERETTQ